MSSLERAGMSVAWPGELRGSTSGCSPECVRVDEHVHRLGLTLVRLGGRTSSQRGEVERRGSRELGASVSLEVCKATTGLARVCARAGAQERGRVGAHASGEEGFPSAAKPRPVVGQSASEVRRERESKAWP
jgi:hypothetical protein